MTGPKRIQLSRAKGWRKPEGAVVVARPTKWGNPFRWQECPPEAGPPEWARGAAVDLFREWLDYPARFPDAPPPPTRAEIREALAGRDLCCWCPPGPCHADVLMEIANAAAERDGEAER